MGVLQDPTTTHATSSDPAPVTTKETSAGGDNMSLSARTIAETEDTQYVSYGPRRVVVKSIPSTEELEAWKQLKREKDGEYAFTPEWYCENPIGFYLFSAYVKKQHKDYFRLNFIEYISLYQQYPQTKRATMARKIARTYLMKHTEPPPKKDIALMTGVNVFLKPMKHTTDEIAELVKELSDPSHSRCPVGLDGSRIDDIIEKSYRQPTWGVHMDSDGKKTSIWQTDGYSFPTNLFDELELVVFESLKWQYWTEFLKSFEHKRILNLWWYAESHVCEEDFTQMRALGRGGYGLVVVCKKKTSGKLYAMKIMSKKRLKVKKAQQLTLFERNALAAVNNPFVISLNYSLQTEKDVYLVLDLMTGGNLEYHLQQRGSFNKRETIYYASRIMLGLQAIHDAGYVYRDLKPENCLLDEFGHIKITDLGLAVPIHPKLVGAAGTRGYWAPEMLIRDAEGNRVPYDQTVDWFSFGCILAEFIQGSTPFLSIEAFRFGQAKGFNDEKAIDRAIMEMEPPFESTKFSYDELDLCRKLLIKNPKDRLGANGCVDIQTHAYFKGLQWDVVVRNRTAPPFEPPREINAISEDEIGHFEEDDEHKDVVLDEKDHDVYNNWEYVNPQAQINEVLEYLVYEKSLKKKQPDAKQKIRSTENCCVII